MRRRGQGAGPRPALREVSARPAALPVGLRPRGRAPPEARARRPRPPAARRRAARPLPDGASPPFRLLSQREAGTYAYLCHVCICIRIRFHACAVALPGRPKAVVLAQSPGWGLKFFSETDFRLRPESLCKGDGGAFLNFCRTASKGCNGTAQNGHCDCFFCLL